MKERTTFTIAVDKDRAVKEAIKGLSDWRPFKTEEGDETDREIAEDAKEMYDVYLIVRLSPPYLSACGRTGRIEFIHR